MDRSLLSGFVSIFGSRLVVLAVTIVTTPLLYQFLGDRQLGIYATLMSVSTVVGIFVTAGVTDGVRKFVAEDRERDGWAGYVVGFYFRLALVLALGGAAVIVLVGAGLEATDLMGRFLEENPERGLLYFGLLGAFIFASQFREYATNALRGFGLERESEPLKVLKEVVSKGTAVLLVWLGYGVAGALAALILASVLVALAGFAMIHRRVSLAYLARRTPTDFPRRQLVSFNSGSILLVFLIISLYHVDVLMLQVLHGSNADVGQYRAALTLAEFLWLVPLSIQALYVHSMSDLWSRGRVDRIERIAGLTTRYALLVTTVMAVGLAALADTFVPFYLGAEYTPAVTPLLLLLPGCLGFAIARPVLAIQQGKGNLGYPIAATGAAALLNAVLNVALIPRFGMAGAAVATSTGYGSMFLFHLVSARRFVGFDPLVDARPGRVALTTACAAPVIYLLAEGVGGGLVLPGVGAAVPLSLLVVPPAGLAAYLLAAFAFGALDVAEVRDVLTSVLPDGMTARTAPGDE